MKSVRLIVIAGATASGKTQFGVELAHKLKTEIISADSRQVYRELNIGSGKDLHEYSAVDPAVPHHMIDVADPREIYSVFHYQRDCYALLESMADREQPILMVGGTGLWIEAVLKGYRIPNVPEDIEQRIELMEHDHDALIAELRQLDAELCERTDTSSKKRVVRSIEIARHAEHHELITSPPPPVKIDARVLIVDVDPEELARRIERRLLQRFEQGMLEEVEALLANGLTPARMAQLGLEYREITQFILGDKSRAQMESDLAQGIRKFAKRQRTWFRGLPKRGVVTERFDRSATY
jgi:tRNA dimethylallyltransferase